MKRKLTPEHKAAIAAAHRGRRHSHETLIRMSLARRAMLTRRAREEARSHQLTCSANKDDA
jgi:hypothetical protein